MKLVACALSLVITLALGCGGSQATQVKQVAYACSTVDIGRTIPEIGITVFQDVLAVIQAGSDGWETELVEIGTKYGEDALACAAKAVYDKLTQRTAGIQAATVSSSAPAARVRSFIDARAYKYK